MFRSQALACEWVRLAVPIRSPCGLAVAAACCEMPLGVRLAVCLIIRFAQMTLENDPTPGNQLSSYLSLAEADFNPLSSYVLFEDFNHTATKWLMLIWTD